MKMNQEGFHSLHYCCNYLLNLKHTHQYLNKVLKTVRQGAIMKSSKVEEKHTVQRNKISSKACVRVLVYNYFLVNYRFWGIISFTKSVSLIEAHLRNCIFMYLKGCYNRLNWKAEYVFQWIVAAIWFNEEKVLSKLILTRQISSRKENRFAANLLEMQITISNLSFVLMLIVDNSNVYVFLCNKV